MTKIWTGLRPYNVYVVYPVLMADKVKATVRNCRDVGAGRHPSTPNPPARERDENEVQKDVTVV